MELTKDKNNIPVSALYTAAAWQWAGFPGAELVTPKQAKGVFDAVNGYMALYRLLNPKKVSLCHNLVHRHASIDALVLKSSNAQVIEWAAGFSPRGLHISGSTQKLYIEYDLGAVAECKDALLNASAEGRNVLRRENYQLRSGDVTQSLWIANTQKIPSTIISEGLMMYFARSEQLALWITFADFLRQAGGGEYIFDYIPLDIEPPRSWLGEKLSAWKRRKYAAAPSYAYDERSHLDVRADLIGCGFSSVAIYDTAETARSWQLPFPNIKSNTLIYHCKI